MSQTRVYVSLTGKNLKDGKNNKLGNWVRWDGFRNNTYNGGRTGEGSGTKDADQWILNAGDKARVEAYLTTEPKSNQQPKPDKLKKETLMKVDVKPLPEGGDVFLYISRLDNKLCIRQKAKKGKRREERKEGRGKLRKQRR